MQKAASGNKRQADATSRAPSQWQWQDAHLTFRLLAVLIGFGLLIPLVPARALDMGVIMTGSPGSTAVRFGQDIARLAAHFGITLKVLPSEGALENIEALIAQPDVQLGVVQSDTLDFVRSFSTDPDLQRRAKLMRVVSPLYLEEVHVLASARVASFSDLQGRRVAVGAQNSGTLLTATLLLTAAGIAPAEELRIDGEEALAALREGHIDAMIYVAGQPAALLKERVAIEDALHLLPVDLPALRRLYPVSVIPADTYYPWQPTDVPTIAPRAVLMTLAWSKPGYSREACRLVGKIGRIIADNLDRLRYEGHPKWHDVDIAADIPGWERSRCVEEARGAPASYTISATEELDRPAAFLTSEPRTTPQETPAQRSGASPRTCSAEGNPIRRRLCEVRPQLGLGP
jgi:TRAP transporter TAXI family solute receptor